MRSTRPLLPSRRFPWVPTMQAAFQVLLANARSTMTRQEYLDELVSLGCICSNEHMDASGYADQQARKEFGMLVEDHLEQPSR